MTANLNSARCAQLRIGSMTREPLTLRMMEFSMNGILDEVNLLVKLAEGEQPMKYCRDCSRNGKGNCDDCYSTMQMPYYKKVK